MKRVAKAATPRGPALDREETVVNARDELRELESMPGFEVGTLVTRELGGLAHTAGPRLTATGVQLAVCTLPFRPGVSWTGKQTA